MNAVQIKLDGRTPMQLALDLATLAAEQGEVPVAAVVMRNGEVLSTGLNTMKEEGNPTAHAELKAIQAALEVGAGPFLSDCDLYVTLEPCTMCAGAIAHARLRRLYFGAFDPKGGAVENGVKFFDSDTCHHRPEIVGGVLEEQCSQLLSAFFAARR